jgi:hypothetical protein
MLGGIYRGRRSRRAAAAAAAAAALALVAASCGSTVDEVGPTGAGAEPDLDYPAGDGPGAGSQAVAGGDTGTSIVGGTGSGGTGRRAGSTDRSSAGPGSPGSSDPGRTPGGGGSTGLVPAGAGVKGVTDKAVQVGIWYWEPGSAGATVSGVGGLGGTTSIFPRRSDIQKIVDHVNATGGMAGRKLEPVYFEGDAAVAANVSTRDQEEQRACATWTEDHHVFALERGVDTAPVRGDLDAVGMHSDRNRRHRCQRRRVD